MTDLCVVCKTKYMLWFHNYIKRFIH